MWTPQNPHECVAGENSVILAFNRLFLNPSQAFISFCLFSEYVVFSLGMELFLNSISIVSTREHVKQYNNNLWTKTFSTIHSRMPHKHDK